MDTKLKLAVLIDGDNAEAALLESMISEISKYGKITIKRIYGDWSSTNMKSWRESVNKYAFRPMQQIAFTKGKNSTDSVLIIDAMDILNRNTVDGFCIISSDSDFTGIANRIREEGLFMMGIGRKDTPEAFVKACEIFKYTEILKTVDKSDEIETDVIKPKAKENQLIETPKLKGITIVGKIDLSKFPNKVTSKKIDPHLINEAFNMSVDDSGMALACRFKESLTKIDPSFDHRVYRHTTFKKFLEALVPPYELFAHQDGTTISIKKQD